jgi:DNA-binding NtrC family response regulator
MATLLIVDDDTLIRDTLHELLSLAHECHTADRAEQALAYLDIETYDAVLTDISMPGLSGRDLLRYIQAKHSSTPVIVISGLSDGGDSRELLEMGAFDFFTKPFKLEEVEAAVDRAIAYRQELTKMDQNEPTPDENALDSESSTADTDSSN